MRRLVAVILGGIFLAAPAVTLACRWSCAEPSALTADKACHESPVPALALTGSNACAEHPATDNQAVSFTRAVVVLPMAETPAVLPGPHDSPVSPIAAIGYAFSPPRPPLALRI